MIRYRDFLHVKKGDRIRITKEARPHRVSGFVSARNDLPREETEATVRKVTKTKRGRKVHVTDVSPSHHGAGFAIMIDDKPDFMTVEKI